MTSHSLVVSSFSIFLQCALVLLWQRRQGIKKKLDSQSTSSLFSLMSFELLDLCI